MKITKKILIIIMIFAILQFIGILFTNEVHADIISDIANNAKQFEDAGKNTSNSFDNSTNQILGSVGEIYDIIRVLVAGAFMIAIAVTGIKLTMSDVSGAEKGKAKIRMAIMFVLALCFIFAQTIFHFMKEIFDKFSTLLNS